MERDLYINRTLAKCVRWFVLVMAILAIANAQASTFTTGTGNCASCHGQPPRMLSQDTTYGKIIPRITAAEDLRFDQSCTAVFECALRQKVKGMAGVDGTAIANNFDAQQMEDIRLYLRNVRDAAVSGATPVFPRTGVGSFLDKEVVFTATNYRATPLNWAVDAQSTVSDEFTLVPALTASDCGGSVPAAASAAAPVSCTIRATVRFKPAGIASSTGNLRLTLTPPDSADPVPPPRNFALSGQGFAPLTASANSLNLNTTVGIAEDGQVILTNGGGTNVNITGLEFSTAASAAGYAAASDNDCNIGKQLAANSGFCTLRVVFTRATEILVTPGDGATLKVHHSGFGSPETITLTGSVTTIPRAAIQLSPGALGRFEAEVGSSAAKQTIVVHNSGDVDLRFSRIAIDGVAASEFVRGGTCNIATALPPGPSSNTSTNCTIELTFTPSSLGSREATLTIESNAVISSVPIPLSGSGVRIPVSTVDFAPSGQLDFKLQTIGGIYPARSVTLTNTGNAPLSIGGLVVEGAAFTNVSTTPCPASLASGTSCTIGIRFRPTAATNYTGNLRLTSNAAGSPHTLVLLGGGTATAVPILEWAPPVGAELDFGLVSAGTESATRSVTFVSRGPGGVDLSFVNAVGPDAAAFSVDASSCPIGRSLFQDTPCRVDIRFSPGSGGPKTATLQIVSSGSAPATLKLVGTGLANPAAGLSLSTSAMMFESVRVGAQSAPVELTLSGTGTGAVNVTGLQVGGPYSVQARTCAAVPFVLNAGSSCTVSVTFQPQGQGSASGTLRITTDASPAVREVALNGNGQAAANVSGGGCSIASGDARFDPTLWALVLLALGALVYRRGARAAAGRRQ